MNKLTDEMIFDKDDLSMRWYKYLKCGYSENFQEMFCLPYIEALTIIGKINKSSFNNANSDYHNGIQYIANLLKYAKVSKAEIKSPRRRFRTLSQKKLTQQSIRYPIKLRLYCKLS